MSNREHFSDVRTAYLFRSGDRAAVTLNSRGLDLPSADAPWIFTRSFTLGVQHAGLLDISPEPIIRGIRIRGHYVWIVQRGGEGQSQ